MKCPRCGAGMREMYDITVVNLNGVTTCCCAVCDYIWEIELDENDV